jgi:hypothetical protein
MSCWNGSCKVLRGEVMMKRTLQVALFALPLAWTATVLAENQDTTGSGGGALGGASDAVRNPTSERTVDTPTPFDLDESRTRSQKRAAQIDSQVPTQLEGPTDPARNSDEGDLRNLNRGDIPKEDVRPSSGSDLKLREPSIGDETLKTEKKSSTRSGHSPDVVPPGTDDTRRQNDKSDSELMNP